MLKRGTVRISRNAVLGAILPLLLVIVLAVTLFVPRPLPETEALPMTVTHVAVELAARSPTVVIWGQGFGSPQILMGPVDGTLAPLTVVASSPRSITAQLPQALATAGDFDLLVTDGTPESRDDGEISDARRSAAVRVTVGSVEALSNRLRDKAPRPFGLSTDGRTATLFEATEIAHGEAGEVLDAAFIDRIDRPLTRAEFQRLVFVEAEKGWVQTFASNHPFGQKYLTTPWPMVNGSRTPIPLKLPNSTATLAWVAQGIKGTTQVEYEVKFGSTYTKLDGDEPGLIANGTVKQAAGSVVLDLASFGKGPGKYYLRVAAQDGAGKDLAYRSQPVVVTLEPKGLPLLVPEFLNITTVNEFTKLKYGLASGVSVSFDPMSFPEGPPYVQWRTSLKTCPQVRFEVVSDEFKPGSTPLYSKTDSGSLYKLPNGDPVPGLHRWGRFDLAPLYVKLMAESKQPGQTYALRVVPIDAQGKDCSAAAKPLYLQYFEPHAASIEEVSIQGQFLVGKPTGSLMAPPIKEGYHTVTPDFNCWKDNSTIFIELTEEMDQTSVEQALTFSPPWPDPVIEWYSKGSKITGGAVHTIGVGHMSNLWFDTVYTVTLGTGAKTKGGKSILQTPVHWRFKTLPYADKIPSIDKLDYTKTVGIPTGEMTVDYAFSNVVKGSIRLWNVYNTNLPQQLPTGKSTATVWRVMPPTTTPPQGPQVQVLLGNALAVIGGNYPFKVIVEPLVKTDLAISAAHLIPGKDRMAKVHLNPTVKVTNNGPGSISKDVLPLVKLSVLYYVSPPSCSGTWCKWAARKVAAVTTLKSCKAPLKKGQSCTVTPTSKELPKGLIKGPVRLYGADARLTYTYNTHHSDLQVLDGNKKNNDYFFEPNTPVTLGLDPLPYEVIVFDQPSFKGNWKAFELFPSWLQYQVPHLGAFNDKPSSVKVGSKVRLAAFEAADYEGKSWTFTGATKQLPTGSDNVLSSLIVYDAQESGPWGVQLTSASGPGKARFVPLSHPGASGHGAKIDNTGKRLPEPPAYYAVEYFSHPGIGVVNDDVASVRFSHKFGMLLYKAGNQQGDAMWLKGPGSHSLKPGWKDTVSSLRMAIEK